MKNIKKFLLVIAFLIFIFPVFTEAKEKYEDVVAKVVSQDVEDGKINLYLFHGQECPHCREEKEYLKTIQDKYKDKVNFVYYEVWHNEENANNLELVKDKLKIKANGVPLTIIGKDYYIGFSETTKDNIENSLNKYINNKSTNIKKIPFIGKVNLKKVSIPLVTIILGFVDGFNPCAMWVLLFLINMLFGMKNKKRMWILGITFLLVSGGVYLLSMLGMSVVLNVTAIKFLRVLIAIVALVAGIFNIRKFIEHRKQDGCQVVDDKKRKNIFTKINKITHEKNFFIALIGVAVLAISVNLIELACSLGFPMVFSEILALNNITGISRILYLLLYVFFYLIDDLVVFIIAMVTLELTGISTKYNKIASLVGGIIMILMAILLIFKPDWLMFNF